MRCCQAVVCSARCTGRVQSTGVHMLHQARASLVRPAACTTLAVLYSHMRASTTTRVKPPGVDDHGTSSQACASTPHEGAVNVNVGDADSREADRNHGFDVQRCPNACRGSVPDAASQCHTLLGTLQVTAGCTLGGCDHVPEALFAARRPQGQTRCWSSTARLVAAETASADPCIALHCAGQCLGALREAPGVIPTSER